MLDKFVKFEALDGVRPHKAVMRHSME